MNTTEIRQQIQRVDAELFTLKEMLKEYEEDNPERLKMLSLNDASKETGLSYTFIKSLAENGKIKAILSGRKMYVNMNSLYSYLNKEVLENDKTV